MTAVVLDCSAALALVLPDERSESVERYVSSVVAGQTELLVPGLWWHECTNVLLTATRRERINAAEARAALSALGRLPTTTGSAPTPAEVIHLFHLGMSYGLTAYDAAYLSLAELSGGTLLSLDKRVTHAAKRAGIPVADL